MDAMLQAGPGKTCDDPDFFPGRGAKRTVFGPRKTGHDILSSSSLSAIGKVAAGRSDYIPRTPC